MSAIISTKRVKYNVRNGGGIRSSLCGIQKCKIMHWFLISCRNEIQGGGHSVHLGFGGIGFCNVEYPIQAFGREANQHSHESLPFSNTFH